MTNAITTFGSIEPIAIPQPFLAPRTNTSVTISFLSGCTAAAIFSSAIFLFLFLLRGGLFAGTEEDEPHDPGGNYFSKEFDPEPNAKRNRKERFPIRPHQREEDCA